MSSETSYFPPASSQHSEDGRGATSPFNDSASQSTTTSAARRKKHVTTACVPCRKSKAKCDGKQPCGRCSEKLYTCVFAPDEDNRNRSVMKRRITELEGDVSILYALLSAFRTSDDGTVAKLIDFIRKGATPREIKDFLPYLQDGTSQSSRTTYEESFNPTKTASNLGGQQSDNSDLPVPANLSPQNRAMSFVPLRRVFGVDRLTDIPIHRVPASPWTSITDDHDLVSHLVSLYATWEHSFFDGIILELFVRDMKSQNTASNFCSSFLVNCILATACPYSDFDEVRTGMGRTSTLMSLFIEQAEFLREECMVTSVITAAQGLSILSIATRKQSDHVSSRYYIQAALSMCATLSSVGRDLVDAAPTPQLKEDLMHAIDSTVWGVLTVSGVGSHGLRLPTATQPLFDTIGDPPRTWRPVSDVWQPYPLSTEAKCSLYGQSRQYFATLSILNYQVLQSLPRAPSELNQVESYNLSRRLADLSTHLFSWLRGLSTQFRTATSVLPISAVLLRWSALDTAMTIFKTQAELGFNDMGQWMGPSINAGIESESTQRGPKQNLISSALDTLVLCGFYKEIASDYSRIHPSLSSTFREALLALAEANTRIYGAVQVQLQSYDAELTELCIVFRDMARRNPYTATLAHQTLLEIRDRNWWLPLEAVRHLQHIDRA